MTDAVRWGRLAANPAENADPPRLSSHRQRQMRTWNADQLASFLTFSAGLSHPLHSAWTLEATTGVRRGELLGVRWRDLDLEEGQLSIQETVISVAHRVMLSTPKTRKGRRRIALDPRTVAVLREHRARQAEVRLAAGPRWDEHDLVFCRDTGVPLHPDQVSKTFRRLVRESELPEITLQELRHTHATLALTAGVHPKVVSERLGHSSVSITLDIYSHVLPSLQTEVAGIIGDLAFGSER